MKARSNKPSGFLILIYFIVLLWFVWLLSSCNGTKVDKKNVQPEGITLVMESSFPAITIYKIKVDSITYVVVTDNKGISITKHH